MVIIDKKTTCNETKRVFYRLRPKTLNSGLHANHLMEPIFGRSFSFIDTNNWTKFEFLKRKETVVYSVEAFSGGLNFSASAS